MNSEWERVEEIFQAAIAQPSETRSEFVREACHGHESLAQEVVSMLRAHADAGQFLERPAIELHAATLAEGDLLRTGETLGNYRIVSLLGEGGMSEVYLADDPELRRKVAIKLMKRGLAVAGVARQLRHEARILAGLDDPHIARLYGVATTSAGVPYFIMEYVEGERLNEYCQRCNLTINQRIELFRKICAAVSYAHRHLVIHRDIKPANIRVTPDGEPKLLDFGIAKLLDPETTETGDQTITLAGVMTPPYASPEQMRGEGMTTASDIYSLGVLLYELLTGERPYRLTNLKPHQIAQTIRDQEPVRPSLLRRELAGDLDTILLMALRKEPERRYSSAGQFSEDLRRHLDQLPVVARRDTFTYRSSKFIRRHRVAVAAALLTLLSLVGGIIATTWEAQVARHEKAKAEDVKNALVRMLNYSNPVVFSAQSNGQKTVKEILDEAAKRLENGEFSNQPEIKVELEEIIAACYWGEGNSTLASKYTEEYLDLHRKLYGENDVKTLVASENRAALLFEEGKLTESERHYRQILPLMRSEERKGNIKAEHLARALNNFGYLRRTQGDSKEAEILFRESLALSSQIPKESLYIIGPTRSTLASTVADQGRFEEALLTAREAVAEYRQREEINTPNFGFTLTVLGGFLAEKGNYAEADTNLHEAEVIFRRLLAPSNLWLGDNLRNQAASYYQQGSYAESRSKVEETLKIYLESFGKYYDNYPTALIIQGLTLARTGQREEGEKILREAVQLRTESLPKEHYWVALAHSALGECLTIQERYAEAEPLLLESYESLKHSLGANNPRTSLALQRLTQLYEKWKKPDLTAKYRALP